MKRVFLAQLLSLVVNLPVRETHAKPVSHLAGSTSPYLLQHADNPVDWYPWGPEALQKARSEDKLILISVGYASCHWCHVMEKESFMNEEIAALLNPDFISVKIDRESRPDLDEQFMTATQLMTGSGGWSNIVFLTSDGDPFFAATYLPPDKFRTAISFVQDAWTDDRRRVRHEAARVTRAVSAQLSQKAEAQEIRP
ncbi:thioredoxin domain-containing protein [Nisaea sp.]|uniref:thioredoxin domain-containing protein n=1 Tax=Nisaea sp. TaxID=2024842 RepID=UPI0032983E9D